MYYIYRYISTEIFHVYIHCHSPLLSSLPVRGMVLFFMRVESRFRRIAFGAHFTRIRFDASVDSTMHHHVVFHLETSPAIITAVRLLSCMSAHVVLQRVRLLERLATKRALIGAHPVDHIATVSLSVCARIRVGDCRRHIDVDTLCVVFVHRRTF